MLYFSVFHVSICFDWEMFYKRTNCAFTPNTSVAWPQCRLSFVVRQVTNLSLYMIFIRQI